MEPALVPSHDDHVIEEELAAVNALIEVRVESDTEGPKLAYDVMTLVAHRSYLESLIDDRPRRRESWVRRAMRTHASVLGWGMLALAVCGAIVLAAVDPDRGGGRDAAGKSATSAPGGPAIRAR